MRQSYLLFELRASQNIFAGLLIFVQYPRQILGKILTYVVAPGDGLAGKPMGAKP
jgi:hypothetical protein